MNFISTGIHTRKLDGTYKTLLMIHEPISREADAFIKQNGVFRDMKNLLIASMFALSAVSGNGESIHISSHNTATACVKSRIAESSRDIQGVTLQCHYVGNERATATRYPIVSDDEYYRLVKLNMR